ncbi:acyl-CoA N-acyltransferase [Stipitochalara longipes BDJ]|nr:acyl-CoA N-acyltransferase [Stipitochalara longipes BDJ]
MAAPKGLFSPSVISAEVTSSLPEGYTIRPLEREDYHKGFFECIQVLTSTGDISEARFHERYDYMKNLGVHYFLVIEHEGRIVGTGTLMVERKFIHNLGSVAHIEEIAIRKEEQGKRLGLKMLNALSSVAKNVGCYKSILGCGPANEGFYQKCGFTRGGLDMNQYYEEEKNSWERG